MVQKQEGIEVILTSSEKSGSKLTIRSMNINPKQAVLDLIEARDELNENGLSTKLSETARDLAEKYGRKK